MKLVAAMSGGVDSSLAAALAQRQGHEIIGVTLRLRHPDPLFSAAQLCAGKNDELAVQSVCETLGIEHHFIDRYPEFEQQVLRPAADEYAAGRTPNPCCRCNAFIKFATLFEYADSVGADGVLTGHYVRLEREGEGGPRLRRGSDPARDQSYFLYRLSRSMLERLHFPVGELDKAEVRRLAAEIVLPTASRPDSQDASFQVPGECFGETLRRLFELPPKPGRFLYRNRAVGRHTGIHQYTIGQRKGLNVALGRPAYIVEIDPSTGDITLETDEETLFSQSFSVRDLVNHSGSPLPERLEVQVRYRGTPVKARLLPGEDGTCTVIPDDPLRAVTPGQAAVFYDGEYLLGGGTIG